MIVLYTSMHMDMTEAEWLIGRMLSCNLWPRSQL